MKSISIVDFKKETHACQQELGKKIIQNLDQGIFSA